MPSDVELVKTSERLIDYLNKNKINTVIVSGAGGQLAAYFLRQVCIEKGIKAPRFIAMGFLHGENGTRTAKSTTYFPDKELIEKYKQRLEQMAKKKTINKNEIIFILEEYSSRGISLDRARRIMQTLGYKNTKIGALSISSHNTFKNIKYDFVGSDDPMGSPGVFEARARVNPIKSFLAIRKHGERSEYTCSIKTDLRFLRERRERIRTAIKQHFRK